MIKHIVKKIEEAEIYQEPFPHLIIDNIFDEETYKEIIEYFPETLHKNYYPTNIPFDSFMKPLSKLYSDRYVLDLDKHGGNYIRNYPSGYRVINFWKMFSDLILHSDIQDAFRRKYSPFIEDMYWQHAFPTARVSIDYKPYSIGTHRDKDEKLVSVMFYTPHSDYNNSEWYPDLADNYGTALMVPKDANMKITDQHYDLNLFETVKIAQYRPNRLFSWPVLHNSFHGVFPLKYNLPRQTIGYFIKNTTNTKGRFN